MLRAAALCAVTLVLLCGTGAPLAGPRPRFAALTGRNASPGVGTHTRGKQMPDERLRAGPGAAMRAWAAEVTPRRSQLLLCGRLAVP